jgi:hypothetical protein
MEDFFIYMYIDVKNWHTPIKKNKIHRPFLKIIILLQVICML